VKKTVALIVLLLAASSLFAMRAGLTQVVDPARPQTAPGAKSMKFALAYLDTEIREGRFVLKSTQRDTLSPVVHQRYQQMAGGLPVWGGEIVLHMRNGKAESCDGEYYVLPSPVDPSPKLTRTQALQAIESGLKEPGLEIDAERSGLVIYPVSETEFRLAHKLWVRSPEKPLFNETALVDAVTGAILLHFSNIRYADLTIGLGIGQRGDPLKFPTSLLSNLYYMMDQAAVRPFVQKTFDAKHQYGASISVSNTSGNSWASDNIVNVHTYIGYTYDFYYTQFGLKGPNNANMNLNAFAHVYSTSQGLYDNAFWHEDNSMYGQGFYILDPYISGKDYGAAIDVVGHELSHAVTTYHSNLTYYGESGALNESFSDIIGTAVEWLFQAPGTGYNKADWVNGEDAGSPFSYDKSRRQDNPNLNSQLKNAGYPSAYWYPDPAHITQKVPTFYNSYGQAIDSDNVHINCTIYPHLFYLLANGGTNPVSGLTVASIGFDAATKIFYDAFVNRMTSSTNFLGAANALLTSAYYLYGASSNEYAQMKSALRAIGYIVN
jgi:thermolysin